MNRGMMWARYYAIRSMISHLIAAAFCVASMTTIWGYGYVVLDEVVVSMQSVSYDGVSFDWSDFCDQYLTDCASGSMAAGTTLLSFTMVADAVVFLIAWGFRYRTGRFVNAATTSWFGAVRAARFASLLTLGTLVVRIIMLIVCTTAASDTLDDLNTDSQVSWSVGQICLLGSIFSTLWASMWLHRMRRRLIALQASGSLLPNNTPVATAVAAPVATAVAAPYAAVPTGAAKLPPQQLPPQGAYQQPAPAYSYQQQPQAAYQQPQAAYQQQPQAYQQPPAAYQQQVPPYNAAVPPPSS